MSSEKRSRRRKGFKDRDVTRIAQVTGMAARAGEDAVVSGRPDSAPLCCRACCWRCRDRLTSASTLSAMVPAGGSSHAHSGGLQQIRVTMCLGLPVAYLEAFVVQYAFTPRGRCSDMDVGEEMFGHRHLKHEGSRIDNVMPWINVTLSQPRYASYFAKRRHFRVGTGWANLPPGRREYLPDQRSA